MNLDTRLLDAGTSLDDAIDECTPSLADLDRRHRRSRMRRGFAFAGVMAILVGSAVSLTSFGSDGESVTAGQVPDSDQPSDPIDRETFVLTEAPAGLELVTRPQEVDMGGAFSREEFTEVHVRFAETQDPLSPHAGPISATIRVAVGRYDERLREVFPGPGTRVVLGGLDFEVVVVDRPTFTQTALVPVETSERTFLVTGRNVDAETLISMAETIDPSSPVPNAGPAPIDFVAVHSGRAEFPSLVNGTAVSYEDEASDRSITIVTYEGTAISCFAYSWVFPNTEIARIGGDAGVIAQLGGAPGRTGVYTALWNHDHDTLVAVTAVGVDRAQLTALADDLQFEDAPVEAYIRDLPFAF